MRLTLVAILIVPILAGCAEEQASPPAATSMASGPPVSAADLEATVAALETSLEAQRTIVTRYPLAARGAVQHLDPDDHEALWQAATDEVEHLETIVGIAEAASDARRRVGEAYASTIGPATKDTAGSIRRRGDFLGDAAPDRAAFDDWMTRRAAALSALVKMAFEAGRR